MATDERPIFGPRGAAKPPGLKDFAREKVQAAGDYVGGTALPALGQKSKEAGAFLAKQVLPQDYLKRRPGEPMSQAVGRNVAGTMTMGPKAYINLGKGLYNKVVAPGMEVSKSFLEGALGSNLFAKANAAETPGPATAPVAHAPEPAPAMPSNGNPFFTNIPGVAEAQGLQPIQGMEGIYGNRFNSGLPSGGRVTSAPAFAPSLPEETPDYADIMSKVPQGGGAIANVLASREAMGRANDIYNRSENRFRNQLASEKSAVENASTRANTDALNMKLGLMEQAGEDGVSASDMLGVSTQEQKIQDKLLEKAIAVLPSILRERPDMPMEEQMMVLQAIYSNMLQAQRKDQAGIDLTLSPGQEETATGWGPWKKTQPAIDSTLIETNRK